MLLHIHGGNAVCIVLNSLHSHLMQMMHTHIQRPLYKFKMFWNWNISTLFCCPPFSRIATSFPCLGFVTSTRLKEHWPAHMKCQVNFYSEYPWVMLIQLILTLKDCSFANMKHVNFTKAIMCEWLKSSNFTLTFTIFPNTVD